MCQLLPDLTWVVLTFGGITIIYSQFLTCHVNTGHPNEPFHSSDVTLARNELLRLVTQDSFSCLRRPFSCLLQTSNRVGISNLFDSNAVK